MAGLARSLGLRSDLPALRRIHGLVRRFPFWIARGLLARPMLQPVSRLLFDTSLRALGILNYENMVVSGEAWFLDELGLAWSCAAPQIRPTVLDVGANDGAYAELVLRAIPQSDVHAFEPHPRTAERLERRLGGAATIVPAAAGSATGSLDLYDYEDARGSAHASPYREVFTEIHGQPASAIAVPVIKLDDYVRETGLAQVLLLKVDTEGHELEVLKGASGVVADDAIHCVQFEFNEMNVVTRTFLRDFMRQLPDFVFFRLLPRGLVPLHGSPLDEIFAFQNIVAIRRGSPVFSHFAKR